MDDLLSLEARDLLKKFGAGSHKPGSGSAAALLGLLAIKLCQTVAALTTGRPGYEEAAPILGTHDSELADIEGWLEKAFQTDSEIFDEVITLRRERDDSPPDSAARRQINDRLAKASWRATDLPLDMVDRLLRVGEVGVLTFQVGFLSARGDSALAVRAAQGAASGAIAIVRLNLHTTRDVERTRAAAGRSDAQQRTLQEQIERFDRVEMSLRAGVDKRLKDRE